MLVGGVFLAVEWALHPDSQFHYDAWLGVSVAILAVMEFFKTKT